MCQICVNQIESPFSVICVLTWATILIGLHIRPGKEKKIVSRWNNSVRVRVAHRSLGQCCRLCRWPRRPS
jgi:hypothetical protein